MAEINVTPMVDVMLVLLIIFMVAAPLMTSPSIDLPDPGGKSVDDEPPLTLSVNAQAAAAFQSICIGDPRSTELLAKIKAIPETRSDADSVVFCAATRTSAIPT